MTIDLRIPLISRWSGGGGERAESCRPIMFRVVEKMHTALPVLCCEQMTVLGGAKVSLSLSLRSSPDAGRRLRGVSPVGAVGTVGIASRVVSVRHASVSPSCYRPA